MNQDIARAAIALLTGDEYYRQRNQTPLQQSLILQRKYQTLNEKLGSLPREALDAALRITPPCRFERFALSRGDNVAVEAVLDIAHNDGAFLSLMERLKSTFGGPEQVQYRCVCGMGSRLIR